MSGKAQSSLQSSSSVQSGSLDQRLPDLDAQNILIRALLAILECEAALTAANVHHERTVWIVKYGGPVRGWMHDLKRSLQWVHVLPHPDISLQERIPSH